MAFLTQRVSTLVHKVLQDGFKYSFLARQKFFVASLQFLASCADQVFGQNKEK